MRDPEETRTLEYVGNRPLGDAVRGVCSQCGDLSAEFEHVACGHWANGAHTHETPHHRAYVLFGDLFLYCPQRASWLRKLGMKIRQGGTT